MNSQNISYVASDELSEFSYEYERGYRKRNKCPSCGGDGERRYQGCSAPDICRECGGSGKYTTYEEMEKIREKQKQDFWNSLKEDIMVVKKLPLFTKVAIPDATKDKIRLLHDKGWSSAKIQRRFRKYSARQIGAVRGWMKRGKY